MVAVTIRFHAVADDFAAAVFAFRRQGVNSTFE